MMSVRGVSDYFPVNTVRWFWFNDESEKWVPIDTHELEQDYENHVNRQPNQNNNVPMQHFLHAIPLRHHNSPVMLTCVGDGQPTIVKFDQMTTVCSLGGCDTCFEYAKSNRKHNNYKVKRVLLASNETCKKFATWAVYELLHMPYDEEAVRKVIASRFPNFEMEKLTFSVVESVYKLRLDTMEIDIALKKRKEETKEDRELSILLELQHAIENYEQNIVKELKEMKALLLKNAPSNGVDGK